MDFQRKFDGEFVFIAFGLQWEPDTENPAFSKADLIERMLGTDIFKKEAISGRE